MARKAIYVLIIAVATSIPLGEPVRSALRLSDENVISTSALF